MSARRKQDTVLRLLRGEDLELVSRKLAVTAAELSCGSACNFDPLSRGIGVQI